MDSGYKQALFATGLKSLRVLKICCQTRNNFTKTILKTGLAFWLALLEHQRGMLKQPGIKSLGLHLLVL